MATPAQKHFRNQVKKMNREGHDFGEESIYLPIRKIRKQRPWWTYSLLGIVLFLFTFSSIPTKLYHDVVVYKDGKMYDYLKAGDQYNLQSNVILGSLLPQASQLSSINLLDLQRKKEELSTLTVASGQLKAPDNFIKHKESFSEVMQQRLFILTYLEMLVKRGGTYNGELTSHINELNVRQQLEKSSLIQAFEEAKIKYKVLPDGTIEYEYRTYNGKFD
ncbi:hypothetical protein [Bacillus sp. FJAT-27251]|uniref:hypothetical protein n=1 Tax=Bacillus sp. FJAT-27251 TaxID=1684142 RepID=UPI0006A75A19|nr:hypothetical protein [Bacillus sp. FJAT-27251]